MPLPPLILKILADSTQLKAGIAESEASVGALGSEDPGPRPPFAIARSPRTRRGLQRRRRRRDGLLGLAAAA
jgi:hypothetical protein